MDGFRMRVLRQVPLVHEGHGFDVKVNFNQTLGFTRTCHLLLNCYRCFSYKNNPLRCRLRIAHVRSKSLLLAPIISNVTNDNLKSDLLHYCMLLSFLKCQSPAFDYGRITCTVYYHPRSHVIDVIHQAVVSVWSVRLNRRIVCNA